MVRCFWWNSGLTSWSVVRRLVEQHVSTSVLWCTVTALNETCMINKSSAAFYIAPEIIKHKRTKEIGLSTLFLKSMNLNHINFHVVWHDKVECVVVRISYKTTRFTCSTIWYMYNVNMIVWFFGCCCCCNHVHHNYRATRELRYSNGIPHKFYHWNTGKHLQLSSRRETTCPSFCVYNGSQIVSPGNSITKHRHRFDHILQLHLNLINRLVPCMYPDGHTDRQATRLKLSPT